MRDETKLARYRIVCCRTGQLTEDRGLNLQLVSMVTCLYMTGWNVETKLQGTFVARCCRTSVMKHIPGAGSCYLGIAVTEIHRLATLNKNIKLNMERVGPMFHELKLKIQEMFHRHTTLIFSNVVHNCVYIPVSKHFFFPKNNPSTW